MHACREVQLLGYHAARCPHCKKEIYVPEYRQQPGTLEDLRKHSREVLARAESEKK